MAITKTIYLAGCISAFANNNEYSKATGWRASLIDQLLDDIAKNCESKWNWFDPTVNFQQNYGVVNDKTVLQQNIFYLDQSDIMVVNLEKLSESPGTLFEIFYFGEKLKRPIIAFNEDKFMTSPHILPYITVHLSEDKIMPYLDALYCQ